MPRTLCKVWEGPPHWAIPGCDLCAHHAVFPPIRPWTVATLRRLLAEAEERGEADELGMAPLLRGMIAALTGDAP